MLDVSIVEAADDLNDRIHLTNVCQELIPEALTLAGAFDKAGDIHELDSRGDDDVGAGDLP
jgi:hypothetical protein